MCASTGGHPSTTSFREKPTACLVSIRFVTYTVVEAGESFGRMVGEQEVIHVHAYAPIRMTGSGRPAEGTIRGYPSR